MADLLKSMPYYWVTAQSEYSTDILFKSPAHLSELYPRLLSHSTLCFGAKEVMSFLGRKIRPYFEGEIVSDLCDLSFKRIPGSRIKHRVKQNWLKMYDKAGSVLRLEMVINKPEGFTVRKQVTRIFNRCHAHSLIAKIPHSRRWRLTKQGRIAMTASIQLRDIQFPITHMKLTA